LDNTTPINYRAAWKRLQLWLADANLNNPVNVTREAALGYLTWRAKHGGSRNTAALELKMLTRVLGEAVRRGYVATNVAWKLGVKRTPPKAKRPWTNEELSRVDAVLKDRDRYGWLRVTFLLGRYQAARLRQCDVPLEGIRLDQATPTIYYPTPKGGTERAFSQPIDTRLLPELRELVAHRQAAGYTTLCELPRFGASLTWRRFLDGLGIHGVSHHALRVTWITNAALAGIHESVPKRFVNHASSEIHRIYQRFSGEDIALQLARLQEPPIQATNIVPMARAV
jgi:hypothetical protein